MAVKKKKKATKQKPGPHKDTPGVSPNSGFAPPEKNRWKKGVSGNPDGGRKHDPEIRKLKALTKKEIAEVGELILMGNFQELLRMRDEVKNLKSEDSALKVMIAAVAMRVVSKGDMVALDTLLNRLVGKVKDEIDLSGTLTSNSRVVVSLPSNGREAPK